MFGDKQSWNNQGGFPTPLDIPTEMATRAFCIPGSSAWLAVFMGCLMLLADENNWQVFDGGISAEDAAAAAQEIIDSGYDETCLTASDIQTPYWDSATDVDDNAAPSEQSWYGEVVDPTVPADELSFVENLAVWSFTGLLAVGASSGAAILFQTIAPSFVVAMRGNDFAEVIRIVVDGQDQAYVDTTDRSGEIIEIPCVGDPDLETHELYVIKVE